MKIVAACVALIALLSADPNPVSAAIFEICPEYTGKKAYEMDASDEYRTRLEAECSSPEILQVTQPRRDGYGCTWERITNLLDLLRTQKTYPAPLLLKIAIVRQMRACDNFIRGAPQGDGLDTDERHRLLQFNSRIAHKDLQSKKAIAKATVGYLRDSRGVDFKAIRKAELDTRNGFRKSFYEEMNFCFTVSHKWQHIFEFIDQLGGLTDIMENYPTMSDRLQFGLPCRVFVFFHAKIEEMAFGRAMPKWYNFKKEVKHIMDPANDYLYESNSDWGSTSSGF